MSKGSKPRPIFNRKRFEDNFERIFGKKNAKKEKRHKAKA